MSLSPTQLSSAYFLSHLKRVDPGFYEEVASEYNLDPSSSFSADTFFSQEDDFAELWKECDKNYFFQLLEQEAYTAKAI